jgi:hypothetical protein
LEIDSMPEYPVVQEIVLPTPILEDVILSPRRELGGHTSAEKLAGLISLGRPLIIPIQPSEIENRELRNFVEWESGASRFVLLHIAVSFHPSDQLLVAVSVSLSLSNSDATSDPDPIAWSLWPSKMTTNLKLTEKIGFTAKLGLLSYQMGQDTETSVGDPFLVALGERESNPEWRFTGSRQDPLVGIHFLSAVIQAPLGVRAIANVLVAATVRGRLGLTQYRADLKHDYSRLEF